MMGRVRNLLRSEAGSSIVEMALVAPFMAAMVIGMVDLSRAYSTKLEVEQAAQRTIEKVMQQTSVASNYNTALKAEGALAAGVAESAVTPDIWLECNGVRAADFYTSSCSAGQTVARYVTVDIAKTYTPMFGTRFLGANANGSFTLHGEAGIRVQ